MAKDERTSDLSKYASVAAISAAAGALAALMLSPKSGRELRQNIKGKAKEARDEAQDKLDKVKS
jgi:gas vesicle protein